MLSPATPTDPLTRLKTAVADGNLSLCMQKQGPIILQLGLDILRESGLTPAQLPVVQELHKLCQAWAIKADAAVLPPRLVNYTEPRRAAALVAANAPLLEAQTRLEEMEEDFTVGKNEARVVCVCVCRSCVSCVWLMDFPGLLVCDLHACACV